MNNRNSWFSRFLAVLVVLASLALPSSLIWADTMEVVQFNVKSKALKGNLLGDSKKRPVTVYLPPSYCTDDDHHCQHPNKKYPVVYVLPGFLMFRMEASIDALVAQRQSYLQANFPQYANYSFDMDGIALRLMQTGAIPETIIVEVSGMTSYGGGRYDCSAAVGDQRTFVVRDVVDKVDKKFRTKANRNHRALMGFSMGGYGALAIGIEYPEVFGAIALLSPSITNSDYPPTGDPATVATYRLLPNRVPYGGLPVDKLMSAAQTAAVQGTVPASATSDGRFFANSTWTGSQVNSVDPTSPYKAYSVLVDDTNPQSALNTTVWDAWVPTSGYRRVLAGGDNFARTPLFLGRGNSNKIPLHREITDHALLISALNTKGVVFTDYQVNGDHYTSLGSHPDNPGPGTFEEGLKFVMTHMGTQDGNTLTYDSTLANQHAACSVLFPGGGDDEDDD